MTDSNKPAPLPTVEPLWYPPAPPREPFGRPAAVKVPLVGPPRVRHARPGKSGDFAIAIAVLLLALTPLIALGVSLLVLSGRAP